MKYEEVIQRIDKYKESDKHQPIIVDLPNVQVYNKLVKHYNVGDSINLLKDASLFCKEESLPVMDKLLYSLSTMDGMIFLTGLSFYLRLQGENVLLVDYQYYTLKTVEKWQNRFCVDTKNVRFNVFNFWLHQNYIDMDWMVAFEPTP